jgi:hypothetical protein
MSCSVYERSLTISMIAALIVEGRCGQCPTIRRRSASRSTASQELASPVLGRTLGLDSLRTEATECSVLLLALVSLGS